MRFLLPLFASTLIGIGCGGPNEEPARDGSVTAPTDASVDAPDASADAPDARPPFGVVKVTVFDKSSLVAVGAPIVFINPDGTVAADLTTDDAGHASAEVMIGASVTAFVNGTRLQTILGIQPGDDLILGHRPPTPRVPVGSMLVTYPEVVGTTRYQIATQCESTNGDAPPVGGVGTQRVTIYSDCKQDQMEVVLDAHEQGNDLASIHRYVPYVDGGAAALDDLPVEPPSTFTATYINPQRIVGVRRFVPNTAGAAIGVVPDMVQTNPLVVTLKGPNALDDMVVVTSFFDLGPSELEHHVRGAATYSIDAESTRLAGIDRPSVDATGKVTVHRSTSGQPDKPDAYRLELFVRPRLGGTVFTWSLFARDTNDIALPVPPAAWGVLPPDQRFYEMDSNHTILDVDTIPDYDAIRNDLSATFELYMGDHHPRATMIRWASAGGRVP